MKPTVKNQNAPFCSPKQRAREKGQVMFRELWYGVGMFCSAMIGMMLGFYFWSGGISHGPWEHNRWEIEGAIGGAILGTAAWLIWRYRNAPPSAS